MSRTLHFFWCFQLWYFAHCAWCFSFFVFHFFVRGLPHKKGVCILDIFYHLNYFYSKWRVKYLAFSVVGAASLRPSRCKQNYPDSFSASNCSLLQIFAKPFLLKISLQDPGFLITPVIFQGSGRLRYVYFYMVCFQTYLLLDHVWCALKVPTDPAMSPPHVSWKLRVVWRQTGKIHLAQPSPFIALLYFSCNQRAVAKASLFGGHVSPQTVPFWLQDRKRLRDLKCLIVHKSRWHTPAGPRHATGIPRKRKKRPPKSLGLGSDTRVHVVCGCALVSLLLHCFDALIWLLRFGRGPAARRPTRLKLPMICCLVGE